MSVLAILGNGLAVAGNKEKSDSSTTHAAVSDGTIIINDTAKQQQNVDDLSRDVAHANQTLSPIFDKEKEQQRMQTLQLIGEIGNQAADIARTQGDIAGFTAAKAKHPTYTDDQLRETAEFKQASKPFGTGSAIQQAITASTAAIQGLAGGDVAKALAGASAPYLAEVIHRQTTSADGEVNIPANLMAHAVVNAALSLAKGENALAGASSAVTAEAVGLISKAYYDKNPTALKEDEKQTVSALASLAAGLAGGLVGGDTASAVSGMQTGKVTVENNYLNSNEVIQLNKELESAAKNGTDKLEVYEKFAEISQKNREEAVAKSCSGDPFCASGVLAEAEAGTDVATSLRRLPIFSSLSSDDLSQLDRFVLAENEESARAIYQSLPEYVKVALYTKEVGETIGFGAAVGGKGLSALGVIGKGGKGSPLPTPKSTTAANGLNYQSNPKHTLGQPSNRPNAGIEPQNSLKLFEQSIPSSKQYPNKEVRFAVDNKGNIHRFVGTNGEFHWNGSSGDGKNQLTSKQVPSDIQKQLGVRIK